jgi:hypothetical protein
MDLVPASLEKMLLKQKALNISYMCNTSTAWSIISRHSIYHGFFISK